MSFSQEYKKSIISLSQKIKTVVFSFKQSVSTYFHFLKEHRNVRKYFWISMLNPIFLIFVLVVILPLKIKLPIETRQISNESEYMSLDANIGNIDELNKFSNKMTDLKLEEMFLQSQLLLAKSDSVVLILNLVDSTFSLNIRGVNVRECKIYHFKMSHGFKHVKADQGLFDWLSKPFILQKDWATVPKVPIKIRKAPKDTIEAKKYKSEPVTLDKPDVHFTLKFDRNLVIRTHQVESNSFGGTIRKWYYNIRSYLKTVMETFLAFFHLKAPRNPFWIEVKISRNDALAIYRAIPNQAALALKL